MVKYLCIVFNRWRSYYSAADSDISLMLPRLHLNSHLTRTAHINTSNVFIRGILFFWITIHVWIQTEETEPFDTCENIWKIARRIEKIWKICDQSRCIEYSDNMLVSMSRSENNWQLRNKTCEAKKTIENSWENIAYTHNMWHNHINTDNINSLNSIA